MSGKKREALKLRVLDRSTRQRWSRRRSDASKARRSVLRWQMAEAHALRTLLSSYLQRSEDYITLPRIGSSSALHPEDADWAWRPDVFRWPLIGAGISNVPSGTPLDPQTSLFHDGQDDALIVRQLRNSAATDLAPYGLSLEAFGFDGDFVSLAFSLPSDAVDTLDRRHIVQLNFVAESEVPYAVSARLNIQNGPNREQLHSEVTFRGKEGRAEFDLGFTDLNSKRMESAWIDLIFERPRMNRIILRDVGCSRSLRYEI